MLALQLGGARVHVCRLQGFGEDASLTVVLDRRGAGGVALAALLGAVLPPGGPTPLRTLHLLGGLLRGEQCGGCTGHLQHLTALGLRDCTLPDGLGALLATLLPQTPQLRRLNISHCRADGGQLPPALRQLTGLQELTLRNLGLEGLPPGPYLSGEQLPGSRPA
jgi:hypothetical protein